jgi:cyclophilin family peptidyl-prolyl cis-trans isomerase
MKMLKIIGALVLMMALMAGFAAAENPKVLIKTSKGDITVELYQGKAPITVENFLTYVDEKFYDGTTFHRIKKNFMIQGGAYTPDLEQKQAYEPIQNEAKNGLKNARGTMAMARLPDPQSATCQFFINHVDNFNLDYGTYPDGWGYCVFGKVTEGMDVVDAIAGVRTMTRRTYPDYPREVIHIVSITRIN